MKELGKLINMLMKANLEYKINSIYCGAQVIFYENGERVGDAVCGLYTYGGKNGLLEIMGKGVNNPCDEVEGWLTAEEVFERWTK